MPDILSRRGREDVEVARAENERVQYLGDEGHACIRQHQCDTQW